MMDSSHEKIPPRGQRRSQVRGESDGSPDADQGTAVPVCPVCSSPETHLFAEGHDRLFKVAPGNYRLQRCRSCCCVFQIPFPSEESIRRFYPETYWWSEGAGPVRGLGGILQRLEGGYREIVAMDHVHFLERCARNSGAGERALLDIGCGSGLFLHLARRRGFLSHGMDISERAVQAVREQYAIEARVGSVGDDIWHGQRFDFVTLFHVLEHLRDPRAALSYARAQLKPRGSLIVQVPNLNSLQSRFFGKRWYGLDVPRHIINFSPHGLRLLLNEAGFCIEHTARFSLRDNPASIASSLAPALDPIARGGSRLTTGTLVRAVMEITYFGLVVFSTPPALIESALGAGGTIWVCARLADGSSQGSLR